MKALIRKVVLLILLLEVFIHANGQIQKKSSTYLSFQYNQTIHDITKGNNPWGIGAGFQTYFNTKSNFKPTIDITGDIYLESDKVLYLFPDGHSIDNVPSMINVFAGECYYPLKLVYLSFEAGPSFINGNTLFGIKPSFGFYLSGNKVWLAKLSYINIFNRDKTLKEDFGSLSVTISVKLF